MLGFKTILDPSHPEKIKITPLTSTYTYNIIYIIPEDAPFSPAILTTICKERQHKTTRPDAKLGFYLGDVFYLVFKYD